MPSVDPPRRPQQQEQQPQRVSKPQEAQPTRKVQQAQQPQPPVARKLAPGAPPRVPPSSAPPALPPSAPPPPPKPIAFLEEATLPSNIARVKHLAIKYPKVVIGSVGAGVLLVVLLLALLFSSVFGAAYRIGYKLSSRHGPAIEVTIAGEAKELAVILSDPKGRAKEQVRFIGKRELITGKAETIFSVDGMRAGNYRLIVKTVEPDRVVATKTVSLDQLWIEYCRVETGAYEQHINPHNPYDPARKVRVFEIKGITLMVRKIKDVPVSFTELSFTLYDETHGDRTPVCRLPIESVITDERLAIQIPGNRLSIIPTPRMKERTKKRDYIYHMIDYPFFEPGDKFVLEGKLLYSGGELSFTDEVAF